MKLDKTDIKRGAFLYGGRCRSGARVVEKGKTPSLAEIASMIEAVRKKLDDLKRAVKR